MRFFLIFVSICLFNFTTAMTNKTVRTLVVDKESFTQIKQVKSVQNITLAKFSEQDKVISESKIGFGNVAFFIFINGKNGNTAEIALKDTNGKIHNLLIKDTITGNETHLQPKDFKDDLYVEPIKLGYKVTLRKH